VKLNNEGCGANLAYQTDGTVRAGCGD